MNLRSCVLFAALSAVVTAQPVHFRGKVEDGEDVCYYCPGTGFVIDTTPIRLTSSVYNLNLYVGLQVEAQGFWNGSTTPASIDITSLTLVPDTFTLSGGGNLGQDMDATAEVQTGDYAIIALALDTTFFRLPSAEVLMLDQSVMQIFGEGYAGSNGEYEVTLNLPLDPSLVGLRVYGQAYIIPANGGAAYLTNPDEKVLEL